MHDQHSKLRPHLSTMNGVMVVIGVVIGIGIFKTPSIVASNVNSELAFMGAWLLGGSITLIGALCYAELAAAYPHSGGEYHFLRQAFGRRLAILFGWARGTVIQTGAIAAVAFVFGDYATQIIRLGEHSVAVHAAISISLLTGLNYLGTPQSRNFQTVLTVLTLVAMLAVVFAGFLVAPAEPEPLREVASSSAFGLAMILVLVTYGGWNEAAYLSAEVEDPERNMARVLVIGTVSLVAIYSVVNYAFLHSMGLEALRRSDAVGADLMRRVAGDAGNYFLSLIVVVAALSTLNGTIFTGARVYHALGQDFEAAKRFTAWNLRGATPANGLLLQGVIALCLVAFGATERSGFQAMVDYTAPVFWLFLLLVGISLVVLRWKDPERRLPFSVPFYPLTPILFCATCMYMIYASVSYTGVGAVVGLAVLVAGLPLLLLAPATGNGDVPS